MALYYSRPLCHRGGSGGKIKEKRAGGKTATTFSEEDAAALSLLWLALPLLAAFLISQGAVSVFVHRATIVATFPLYLLVGEGIGSLPGRVLKRAAIAVIAALCFSASKDIMTRHTRINGGRRSN